MKKRIQILTAVYKRPDVLRMFLESYVHNRAFCEKFIHLNLFLAGHEEDDGGVNKAIAGQYAKHGVEWFTVPNLPLSNKWQSLLTHVSQSDFDYVMILGSDDLVHNSVYSHIDKAIRAGHDQVGLRDLYVVDACTNAGVYWPGYGGEREGESIGAGRILSRGVLEKAGFVLWADGLNKCLDNSMTQSLINIKRSEQVLSCLHAPIVDVKSSVNMWGIDTFSGEDIDTESLMAKFPKTVYDLYKNIKCT